MSESCIVVFSVSDTMVCCASMRLALNFKLCGKKSRDANVWRLRDASRALDCQRCTFLKPIISVGGELRLGLPPSNVGRRGHVNSRFRSIWKFCGGCDCKHRPVRGTNRVQMLLQGANWKCCSGCDCKHCPVRGANGRVHVLV